MADLSQLLAQLLGQREEERPNLNPHAPSTIPGTRGLFGRRPVSMPRDMGMIDVQPMPIEQARNRQSAQLFPDRSGVGASGWQQEQNGAWSLEPVAPPAPRQRPVSQTNPGAYANFAEYANANTGGVGLGGSSSVVEQPREPLPTIGPAPPRAFEPPDAEFTLDPAYVRARGPINYGADYPSRHIDNGIDPNTGQRVIVGQRLGPVRDRLTGQVVTESTRQQMPDAPQSVRRSISRTSDATMEDEAWAAAHQRARAAIEATHNARDENVGRLPRPGRPLIAQAWADGRQGRRGRTGGGGW